MLDTYYVRTYTVLMNITLSIDEQIVKRAREKLQAVGKSVNEEIRDHLAHVAGDDEIEKDIEFLRSTAGLGDSAGWKWNRNDLYEERLRWPRK
jgi:hypothetical protein